MAIPEAMKPDDPSIKRAREDEDKARNEQQKAVLLAELARMRVGPGAAEIADATLGKESVSEGKLRRTGS